MNVLKKYGLVLLLLFSFSLNAVSQGNCSGPPPPGDVRCSFICPGSLVGTTYYWFIPDDEGDYISSNNADDEACMLPEDQCQEGNCQRYSKYEVPLGNGVFIMLLFILGYGSILYYRHRQKA